MEQASDSSNSVAETASTQQPDTKANSSTHKKTSHKKDKSKLKSTSENEGSKSPPVKETETIDSQSKVGNPAQVGNRTKTTKVPRKQINSEQSDTSQISISTTDTLESLPKSRDSYAENTTSSEEPSVMDDTNMSPTSEATADTEQQTKEIQQKRSKKNLKSYNTEDKY